MSDSLKKVGGGITSQVYAVNRKDEDTDSIDTFIDPRPILNKENLIERKLPTGMNYHEEGLLNLEKNKYYTDYKQKWDNEMYYVVQDYQNTIFPSTIQADPAAP